MNESTSSIQKTSTKQKISKRLIISVAVGTFVIVLFIIFRLPVVTGIYNFVGERAYADTKSMWFGMFSSSVFQGVIANAYDSQSSSTVYALGIQDRTEFLEKTKTSQESELLPEGYSSIVNGVSPSIKYSDNIITKKTNSTSEYKVVSSKELSKDPGTPAIEIVGTGTQQDILKNLKVSYDNAVQQSQTNTLLFSEQSTAVELATKMTEVYDVTFDLEDNKNNTVGTIYILYPICNIYISLPLEINEHQQYIIADSQKIGEYYCASQSDPNASPDVAGIAELSTCEDCWLAPIGKTQKLQADYAPEVISLAELNSEFFIGKEVYDDLKNLMADAKEAGHNIQITSAYRSYKDQVDTFEYWVNREITLFGVDRATAEMNANKYSARPGFSEHQLGTVVDLNSSDCDAFDGYCPSNENMWLWLNQNAYKYGFIRSYPLGKELLTGYVSEPWHYRWIGHDNAAEYKKLETSMVLIEWLRQNLHK